MQISKTRCLMLYTMIPSLVYYINYICKIFGVRGWASTVYHPLITIISALLFFLSLSYDTMKTTMCCIVVWIVLIVSSIASNNNVIFGNIHSIYSFILSDLNYMLSMALPICYIYYLNVEFDAFFDEISALSIVVVSLQYIILLLTLKTGKYPIVNDYMSYSYYGMLSFAGCAYKWSKSVLYKAFACASFLVMFISGCRGALLSALIFVAVLWFMNTNLKGGKGLLQFVGCMLLGLVMIIKINDIIILFSEILSSIGFDSRTISKLSEGSETFFSSQGRDSITSLLVDNFTLFGNGVLGDRALANTYAHNWIIELIYDFGYIYGVCICLFIFYYLIKAIIIVKHCELTSYRCLVAYSSSMIIGKYMFSGSIFTSVEFILSFCILLYINKQMKYRMGGTNERISKNPSTYIVQN